MEEIDSDTIAYLSELARIECSEQEIEHFLEQLQRVLGYVDQLQEVDTEDVPPCSQVSEGLICPMRDDETGETLEREVFLANSPSHIGGMVRVPTVIQGA